MEEKKKRTEPIKAPLIKVDPMPGTIIIELLNVVSKVEEKLRKEAPNLVISQDQIKSRIKQVIENTGDILQVYEQHPDQAIIIALPHDQAIDKNLRVGDKIAFNRSEHGLRPIIYHKKRYYAIFASEILFRYLTDEV